MTAPIAYCLTFISLCCEEITASLATPPDFLTGKKLEIGLFIKKNFQKKIWFNEYGNIFSRFTSQKTTAPEAQTYQGFFIVSLAPGIVIF